jgi:long-subunit fatty acid transport protein
MVLGAALILVTGLSANALAIDDNHALPFLRTGTSARAYGLGNAYVALVDDASAGFYNPAGLSRINKWGFTSLLSADMGEDRKLYSLGLAGSFNWGSVGVSYVGAGVDGVPVTDPNASSDYMDNYFMLSYANCSKAFHWGLSLVVANNDVAEKTGVGGDLGIQIDITDEARIGLVAQSLGLKVDDDKTPYNIRLGLAVTPSQLSGFSFPIEIQKTQGVDDIVFRLGGEYMHAFDNADYAAAIRGGIDDGEFAIGAGLYFKQFGFDYAYVTDKQDFLGENHRFSLTGNF